MGLQSRLEKLEAAAEGFAPREVERIVADAGDGYRIDVDAPPGTLARIARVYGEGGEDEPTSQT